MIYLSIIILIIIVIIFLFIRAHTKHKNVIDEKMGYIRTNVFPDFRQITIECFDPENYYVVVDDKKKYNVTIIDTVGDNSLKRRIEVEELK